MARGLTVNQRDASAGAHRIVVPLLELRFDAADGGTLRFSLGNSDIVDGANTYIRTGPILTLEKVRESSSSQEGVKATMTGLDAAMIAIATAANWRGRLFVILKAYCNPDTNQIINSPKMFWVGRMRAFRISEQNDMATITVQAEHYEVALQRAAPIRLNNVDQQRLHPGDLGAQYAEEFVEKSIIWPSKEALKK